MHLSSSEASILFKPLAGLIFPLLNDGDSECKCERDAEKTRDDPKTVQRRINHVLIGRLVQLVLPEVLPEV